MFMTVQQAAVKWGISDRRVRTLCNDGKIPGAYRDGKSWKIPIDANKPDDGRYKSKGSTLDRIDSKKAEQYAAFFHLGKTIAAKSDGASVDIDDTELCLYYSNDRRVAPVIDEAAYSEIYNEMLASKRITIRSSDSAITHCFINSKAPVSVTYGERSICYRLDDDVIEVPYD